MPATWLQAAIAACMHARNVGWMNDKPTDSIRRLPAGSTPLTWLFVEAVQLSKDNSGVATCLCTQAVNAHDTITSCWPLPQRPTTNTCARKQQTHMHTGA